MDNLEISNELKEKLQTLANEKQTDPETVIKLLMAENEELKKKPTNYLTTTKVSKNKSTFSTVIPAPVKNKLGLEPKQLLYWDIDEYKIVITPEVRTVPTPEEASIQAGTEILNDMLFNDKKTDYYTSSVTLIKKVLSNEKTELTTDEAKVKYLVDYYNNILGNRRNGIIEYNQTGFKQVVLYLLDYPLNLPNQYEILREVYEEITKTD